MINHYLAARAELEGPGSPFHVTTEEVRGVTLRTRGTAMAFVDVTPKTAVRLPGSTTFVELGSLPTLAAERAAAANATGPAAAGAAAGPASA